MRLCIIGGTRFAGRSFVELAVEAGHDVTVVSRGRVPVPCADDVRHVACDRRALTAEMLPHVRYDAVVDQVAFTAADARHMVPIVGRVADRYVCTSSMSVYDAGADLVESVFDPQTHAFDAEVTPDVDYAEAKRQLEAVVAQTCPVPWTTVRFSMIVGPDDPSGRLQWHRDRVRNGLPIFMPAPEARLSFILAHDAGRVLLHACSAPLPGPLNAASPLPVPVAEVVRGFARTFGVAPVWADEPTDENASPYGIDRDWWMNVDRLTSSGLTPSAPFDEGSQLIRA